MLIVTKFVKRALLAGILMTLERYLPENLILTWMLTLLPITKTFTGWFSDSYASIGVLEV